MYPKTLTHSCFEIPNDIGYIWDFAFTDNESLKKVVIRIHARSWGRLHSGRAQISAEVKFGANSELLIVDDFCFSECYAMRQIQLPDSVYLIGEAAFSYTSLHPIHFSRKNRFLGDKLFGGHLLRNDFPCGELPTYIGS